MSRTSIMFILWLLVGCFSINFAQSPNQVVSNTKYEYETAPNDPLGVKIYTLENGLKLYLSVNKDEPRINTAIAVKAGSKNDPPETTGLAHYLEHMLFKGTDKVGALNWDVEKVMLQNIALLYEEHRRTDDPEKRKIIYDKIDRLSNKAAELVAANEYDKMVASLGAKGTNAYTSVEQTVYINDIPSNELGRWMQLESERFSQLVLRLFHTELEAVFEEFNIGQDSDGRKVNKIIGESLYPNHTYGTQTTIGTGEHLKNPSHLKIQEYFKKHYIPNNMAIILAGDFNPDDVVDMAKKYFGNYEKAKQPVFTYGEQPELVTAIRKEAYGQDPEFVDIAWRLDGADSEAPMMADIVRGLLRNGQAGLMDINLLQKQKVLSASAWMWPYKDYTTFGLTGRPREGQSMEELEKLLLGELDKLRNGEFDEWLIGAIIKDKKLSDIRAAESNRARVSYMTSAFVKDQPWKKWVNRFTTMSYVSKDQVVSFVKKHLKNNNCVIVYKYNGEDESVYKVEKPAITPVSLNRDQQSEYTEKFLSKESPRLKPEFVDFSKSIQTSKLTSGVQFDYIKNTNNETFSLNYILEMGKNSDKLLPIAVDYLSFLGTNEYTAEDLQKEFFKLGLEFNVSSGSEQVYVTLSGLEESFKEGVKLFEHILANVEPNQEALQNMINDILLERQNAKKNKRAILRTAMASYARYGETSPFTDILSESDLKNISAQQLVDMIKSLTGYEHKVFYYGSREMKEVEDILKENHAIPSKLKPAIAANEYPELDIKEDVVYFVDFPMVQAEVLMLSKGTDHFDLDEYLMSNFYNNYFGFGLSSIVFQEIRESKALAYSAYAYYTSPSRKDQSHYFQAYVGTQADKLVDAIPAMRSIIEEMPVAEAQVENARQSILKGLESERITNSSIYWTFRSNQFKGYDRDLRSDMYSTIKGATVEDLKNFQQKHVKGRNYAILVLGSKDNVNLEYLKTLGPVKELTLEEVFGY